MPLCFPLNRHMVCGSLPLRTPPVRACYALFLAGAVVVALPPRCIGQTDTTPDPKSTRLNSSHSQISYAVFWLKKNDLRLPQIMLIIETSCDFVVATIPT